MGSQNAGTDSDGHAPVNATEILLLAGWAARAEVIPPWGRAACARRPVRVCPGRRVARDAGGWHRR